MAAQGHERILNEQQAYYRARAPEYDDWFYRRGRYDGGEAANRQWFAEVETLRAALRAAAGARSHALELACGSGIWTAELVQLVDRVTAVDGAPEMLALNRQRLTDAPVRYEHADLFTWQPTEQFPLIFASFWLSHIPPGALIEFLRKLRHWLTPGGVLFAIDSARSSREHARNAEPADIELRELADGRRFRIVKHYYTPAELTDTLTAAALTGEVRITANWFWYLQAGATTGQ